MDILYILGAIGGVVVGIDCVVMYIKQFRNWYKKYQKMKRCYEHQRHIEKAPMGFMTEKERNEIEDRLIAKRGA